jgi:beta-xylosidase
MVCRWATELNFEASTTVTFSPETADDFAGMVIFQGDEYYITFGISRDDDNNLCIKLQQHCGDKSDTYTCLIDNNTVNLKVIADGKGAYYFCANDHYLNQHISADILSTKTAGNFTGTAVGVYATANYNSQQ